MWITLQAIHDQRAQDHGEVGAADAHLAAEEQSGQPPRRIVTQRQAGALLENREHEEEKLSGCFSKHAGSDAWPGFVQDSWNFSDI